MLITTPRGGAGILTGWGPDTRGSPSPVSPRRRQTPANVNPTADAWVSEILPTTNFGSATNLEMRASGSGLSSRRMPL